MSRSLTPSISFRNSLEASITLLAAKRLKIPRSPDLLRYRLCHSAMYVSIEGCLSLYTALLFAMERQGVRVHHCPDLAARILSSERLESEMVADRRTPPTTTHSPTMQQISCTLIE